MCGLWTLTGENPCTCSGHGKLSWRNGQRRIHLANGSVFLGHIYLTCIHKHPPLLSCCSPVWRQTPEWHCSCFLFIPSTSPQTFPPLSCSYALVSRIWWQKSVPQPSIPVLLPFTSSSSLLIYISSKSDLRPLASAHYFLFHSQINSVLISSQYHYDQVLSNTTFLSNG